MAPQDSSRVVVTRTWADRYEAGRKAEATRREYWADVDSGWVMAVELLTATFLWGGIGWLLDGWLRTGPWLMVVGFLLGNATGFYLVYLRSSGRFGGQETTGTVDGQD